MVRAMTMVHDEDPAKIIMDKIGMKKLGELPGFRLMGNRVLIGIYERPAKTKSGIILADQTRREDEHQGKAGLVLMRGRTAFVSDENYDFGDSDTVHGKDEVKPGEWVSISVTNGRKIVIRGQLCRIVIDSHIDFRIPEPDVVY